MPLSFRDLLAGDDLIVAPGAYDAITARAVERAGFPMVHMTGAGVAAARGYPDYGLVTMTEMVDSAATLARSVSVPVLADADTGYGNELNVTRTVREYESRGVAGIHLEDQVSPKRCGHLAGKQVVERERFTSLIRAAVEARSSDGFVIVARTDAAATDGLDEAIARMRDALAAGADVAFVEAPGTADDVAAVPGRVAGPCLLNVGPPGTTPVQDLAAVDVGGLSHRAVSRPAARHRRGRGGACARRAGSDGGAPPDGRRVTHRAVRPVRRGRVGRRSGSVLRVSPGPAGRARRRVGTRLPGPLRVTGRAGPRSG